VEAATATLEGYEGHYLDAWARGLAAKLGIPVDPAAPPGERAASHIEPRSSPVAPAASSGDPDHLAAIRALGEELLELLESQAIDHTGFFRALTEGAATSLFTDPSPFRAWHQRLLDLRGSGPAADSAVAAMAGANPLYIPRNVHLDAALRSAHLGDLEPVHRLLEAVARPFERRPGLAGLEGPGDGGEEFLTFCGTWAARGALPERRERRVRGTGAGERLARETATGERLVPEQTTAAAACEESVKIFHRALSESGGGRR